MACIATGAAWAINEASFDTTALTIGPSTCTPTTAVKAMAARVVAIPWIMPAICAMSLAVSGSTPSPTNNFV
ncbi:hypothetical protein D3C85_1782060 [compost metagenome]